MQISLGNVKAGLALALAGLLFGIGLGISFGVKEDVFKDYIASEVAAHPEVHDEQSESKIWRYAQRAHFHATGIAAFSIGLIILVSLSGLGAGMQKLTALLIGLSGFYPLSWFTMFLYAPTLGREAAHHHVLTETFTYIGNGGLLAGLLLLLANLFLGMFGND